MAHKDNAEWTPNYEELKDIMRPLMDAENKMKAETPADSMEPGDALWAEKVAQEDREQRQLDKLTRRRMKSIFGRASKEDKDSGTLDWLRQLRATPWMVLFRNYAPYGMLLLLAPLVNTHIDFLDSTGQVAFSLPYAITLLATALPLLLLWIWLHPGDPPFFRFAALCLPTEFYFLLMAFRRSPGVLVIPMIWLAVGILLYHFIDGLRSTEKPEKKQKNKEEDEPLNAALVEKAIENKRLRDLNQGEGRRLNQAHYRRVLRFGVRYAAALFAVFIAVGAVVNTPAIFSSGAMVVSVNTLPAAAPEEQEGEALPFSIEQAMGDIALLSPVRWGELSQDQRESAMQALLNAELDNLSLAPTNIDDKEIHTLRAKNKLSIKQALKSNKNKLSERIQAVCYAAYCKKLLTIASAVDLKTYEADAMAYVERRCDYYSVLIAQYWVDGVGENVVE